MSVTQPGISSKQAVKSALLAARMAQRSYARTPISLDDTGVPYYSLLLVSAAALAYEVLLTRLFAIVQWHHFAFMIISLALLGFGVSGTVLALTRRFVLPRFASLYILQLALFGISAVGCYVAAQYVPVNPEEILWNVEQPLRLLAVYLLLAIPFFFAANAIALCFMNFSTQVGRIYAVNMAGSGLGCLLIVALLFLLFPDTTLRTVGALALLAGAVSWLELNVEPKAGAASFVLAALALFLLPSSWTELNISPYKSLPQALQVGGANVVAERSSPLGLVTVVENTFIPWRYAPGLSLNAKNEPPDQVGVFTDGDALTVITRPAKNPQEMDYLDQMTSALPYHLHDLKQVLVLGAGGGADVLQARFHKVPLIEAVELNPQIASLARGEFREFSGDLYDAPDVKLHVAEARGFVAASADQYDLIQLSLLDSIAATTAGLHALSESYLYTVEAFQEYLSRLAPAGYLAITRWVTLPPRDTMKLFATAIAALQRNGVADPGDRLVMIRSWQTATLLIKNGAFTQQEITTMQTFCRLRGFDVAYYAGMQEDETNRFNIVDRAYFYLGTQALIGDKRSAYMERYKFDLTPATDDRPYFFHFFKWSNLGEMLSLRDKGGVALLEWSYLVLVATVLQALLVSALLILGPLLFSSRLLQQVPREVRVGRVLGYFFAIGLAYLFLEIAFIQKFTLLLHHPLYAVALVLASFLIFSGAGSAFAQRLADQRHHRASLWWAVLIIAALGLTYVLVLAPVFDAALTWPTALKITLAVALIAPLAFCMGLPFPLALDQLSADAAALLPWAYGVNACASVVGAGAAMVLAMHVGFIAVTLAALACYALAAFLFPSPEEAF